MRNKTKKEIAAFHHAAEKAVEKPDAAPGNYYVTAVDGPEFWTMLGPFVNDHAAALAAVDEVKNFVIAHDRSGKAHFMGWGTARLDADKPGNANKYLPHLLKGELLKALVGASEKL